MADQRALVLEAAAGIPHLGEGHTVERLRALREVARADLALGRLLEAHLDALQILREAGRQPHPRAVYGVWASDSPAHQLRLDVVGTTPVLAGSKAFCTGSELVDRALVTVRTDHVQLVEVDLSDRRRIETDQGAWLTPALATTSTGTVTFDELPLEVQFAVGGLDWYLDRPGFWHGACAPAACWSGGALGLVDWAAAQRPSPDPHTQAGLGALHAAGIQLEALGDAAARAIDEAPHDAVAAQVNALAHRHLVEQASVDVLRRFARTYGPRPLAFDPIHQRILDLELYLRQCHGDRDLALLGATLAR